MHNVLLVGSTARRIVWNTPQLAALRLKLHAALKPSAHVEAITTHVQEAMAAFAYRTSRPRMSAEYCRQEMLATTMGDSGAGGAGAAADEQQGCDMSAEAVTQVLEERQVGELSRVLYVASGVLNITQVHQLHKQRFVVMSKARFTLDIHPDSRTPSSISCASARRSLLETYTRPSPFYRTLLPVRPSAQCIITSTRTRRWGISRGRRRCDGMCCRLEGSRGTASARTRRPRREGCMSSCSEMRACEQNRLVSSCVPTPLSRRSYRMPSSFSSLSLSTLSNRSPVPSRPAPSLPTINLRSNSLPFHHIACKSLWWFSKVIVQRSIEDDLVVLRRAGHVLGRRARAVRTSPHRQTAVTSGC